MASMPPQVCIVRSIAHLIVHFIVHFIHSLLVPLGAIMK